MTTNKEAVQIIVDLCALKGVNRVVISPGSRNAPLSIAFNRDERIKTFVMVDERCAAFFALGMSQKSCQPVALVCTSGTALLNYAPAIAEAFYQRIPLIVLSADRPTEWIGQDDSQAINQTQVFANFTKFNCQIPSEITCADESWHINRSVNEAINLAVSGRKGPVHINIPLREPLYGLSARKEKSERIFTQFEPESTLTREVIDELKSRIPNSPKIMILSAFMPNDMKGKLNASIKLLESIPNVIVLAEPISNIENEKSISQIDRTLNTIDAEETEAFQPDLLISFGGSLVSKQIKTFLKNNPPKEHWHIGKGENHIDTFCQLTALIQIEPSHFLDQFFKKSDFTQNDYSKKWLDKEIVSALRHDQFMQKTKWSDLKAFEIISQFIPENTNLQLGNSSAVRYFHLFKQKPLISIQCNRGTSGIDGSTSTAVGAAWISNEITTLISGDISFFYDSNAFWNKYLSPNLRIIVLKNGGGSLFRFIPGPSDVEELEEFFETAQDIEVKKIAYLYDLPFFEATNEEELKAILPQFYKPNNKPVILSVNTPRLENDLILKEYFASIRKQTI